MPCQTESSSANSSICNTPHANSFLAIVNAKDTRVKTGFAFTKYTVAVVINASYTSSTYSALRYSSNTMPTFAIPSNTNCITLTKYANRGFSCSCSFYSNTTRSCNYFVYNYFNPSLICA
jgi:hypothetical protein